MRRALLACLLAGVCVPAAASTSAAEPAPAGSVKPLTAINDPYLRDEIAQIGRRRTQQVDATVDVEILHDHVEADIAQRIAQLGGTVTGVAPGTVVQAKVPIAALTNLQSTPGVDFVRRPVNVNVRPATIAVPQAGPVTAEAVSVMKADAWHQAGRTGAGVSPARLPGRGPAHSRRCRRVPARRRPLRRHLC